MYSLYLLIFTAIACVMQTKDVPRLMAQNVCVYSLFLNFLEEVANFVTLPP